jgi:hypothetical protein
MLERFFREWPRSIVDSDSGTTPIGLTTLRSRMTCCLGTKAGRPPSMSRGKS